MHISQIEITGFSYGVLNFVVSFKTQKIQWPKSINRYVNIINQKKGKENLLRFVKIKSLLIF